MFKRYFLFPVLTLMVACENDDFGTELPLNLANLVGKWELKEAYVSPGGATEWQEVSDGHFYIFQSDGTYMKLSNNSSLEEQGMFRLADNSLVLTYQIDGEETTIGFYIEITDKTITLSPKFPAMCIEACLYRFRKR